MNLYTKGEYLKEYNGELLCFFFFFFLREMCFYVQCRIGSIIIICLQWIYDFINVFSLK